MNTLPISTQSTDQDYLLSSSPVPTRPTVHKKKKELSCAGCCGFLSVAIAIPATFITAGILGLSYCDKLGENPCTDFSIASLAVGATIIATYKIWILTCIPPFNEEPKITLPRCIAWTLLTLGGSLGIAASISPSLKSGPSNPINTPGTVFSVIALITAAVGVFFCFKNSCNKPPSTSINP